MLTIAYTFNIDLSIEIFCVEICVDGEMQIRFGWQKKNNGCLSYFFGIGFLFFYALESRNAQRLQPIHRR